MPLAMLLPLYTADVSSSRTLSPTLHSSSTVLPSAAAAITALIALAEISPATLYLGRMLSLKLSSLAGAAAAAAGFVVAVDMMCETSKCGDLEVLMFEKQEAVRLMSPVCSAVKVTRLQPVLVMRTGSFDVLEEK